ncbi:MAG: ribonuclease R [Bdellovibrionales bacterium]
MALDQTEILKFIRSSKKPVTKREVARAFGIKGGENRVALKQILKKLEKDSVITKQPGGVYTVPDGLPSVSVVRISEISSDGEMYAQLVDWNFDVQGEQPKIEIVPDKKSFAKLKEDSRALVRLSRQSDGKNPDWYEARIIKAIDDSQDKGQVMGMLRYSKNGPFLAPADKKAKFEFDVNPGDLNGAKEGDLIVGEVLPSRGLKRKRVKVVEVLGKEGDPKAISLISLHEAGIKEAFPEAVIQGAQNLKVPELKKREDLRDIPLVTIDGADARDFDDAVYAERQDDGGFHLIVAIADVAHYVKHDSALDDEAQRRGNSTYFPDRVVPMLPEALSNDLCSLRPNENRACMVCHMWVDAAGKLNRYKFTRGLMRSAARLIYEQVQAARDGMTDDLTRPLMERVINPLYEAYAVLDEARNKRGALDLDLPERRVVINDNGDMTGVVTRDRLDAHKLIEEFMILANVAAASALEDKRDPKLYPCVYRIHDKPSLDKLEAVREFVESFGISMPKGPVAEPRQINNVLKQAAKLDYSHLISQVILRSQSQAVYHTQNVGHFGLALSKYAHFTSPIRRYADLMVHRSLIKAYGLGDGGIDEAEIARIDEIAEHISTTERTSMVAERNAVDRFTAAYLSEHIGATFEGRINGVTRFGLFVTLNESGADGIVPMRSLKNDFYDHDEDQHALVGKRTGNIYRMGASVTVKLKEADGLTGSTVLEMAGDSVNGADIEGLVFKTKKGHGKNSTNSDRKPYDKKGPRRGPKKGFKKGKRRR